jgi:hypothetical protein
MTGDLKKSTSSPSSLSFYFRKPDPNSRSDCEYCYKTVLLAWGIWGKRILGSTPRDEEIILTKIFPKAFSFEAESIYSMKRFWLMENADTKEVMGAIQLFYGYILKRHHEVENAVMAAVRSLFWQHPFYVLRAMFWDFVDTYIIEYPYPSVINEDDLYVNNLAIFDGYRGNNLVYRLLEFAEQQAHEINQQNESKEAISSLKEKEEYPVVKLNNLRLDCMQYNKLAIRCYERYGMKKEKLTGKRVWSDVWLWALSKPLCVTPIVYPILGKP